jgi:hypothetical protein
MRETQRGAEMNQHKEQMREMIYSADFEKPQYLVHYVGGLYYPNHDAYDQVVESGLQADRGSYDLNLNRPSGIFFFGEEMDEPLSHKVTVQVANLDTDKLYAFPSMLADAVARLEEGESTFVNQPEEWKQALMELAEEIEAVAYADYDGSFAAEWIYTEDIDAELIS